MPKRECVILHLYYQYMWDEICAYLKNLEAETNFDLFITCVERNEKLFRRIRATFNPHINVTIYIVKDIKGADTYPFFYVLNKINLNDYTIIFKLHTKRNLPTFKEKLSWVGVNFYVGKGLWRNFLINAILGKSYIKKTLQTFYHNQKVGMIGFGPLLVTAKGKAIDESELFPLTDSQRVDYYSYFAGTIFAIRANILKPLQYKYDEKPFLSAENKFSPLGWYMEHFYGYLVRSYNFDIVGNNSIFTKYFLELLSHNIYIYIVRQ